MKYKIKDCSLYEENILVEELVKYNLSKVPLNQEEEFIWINKFIEDTEGNILGGVLSKMYCWNCLYIDLLWVDEKYRKNGIGTFLLKQIEKIGKEKGVYLIHIDTFDFQGREFYLKNEYEVFGVLENCPKDHNRYFMKKEIKNL